MSLRADDHHGMMGVDVRVERPADAVVLKSVSLSPIHACREPAVVACHPPDSLATRHEL